MNLSVKENIKRWMHYNNLTPIQLGSKTGIGLERVLNCMYGTSDWLVDEVLKISTLVDISVEQLVHHTPEELMKHHIENHQIHTSDLKVAVRLQNYFTNRKIPVHVDVVFVNEAKSPSFYKIYYESANILEPDKMMKILKKSKKYGDVREYTQYDSIKYERMNKIVV